MWVVNNEIQKKLKTILIIFKNKNLKKTIDFVNKFILNVLLNLIK